MAADDRDDRVRPGHRAGPRAAEGWEGWDEYAPFYDWENARTVGRRDVTFWKGLAERLDGPVLELGCGTGRVLVPLVRAGLSVTGIDRSAAMLARARRRLRRVRRAGQGWLVRGDVRQLPFADARFRVVIAPYGLLQSILSDRDLRAVIESVRRVLLPGGTFGIDLVPDVPHWREYRGRVTLEGRRGRAGPPVTLIETVRQDRRRGLTIFEQEFHEGRGAARACRRFRLTFRTLPVRSIVSRLEAHGFDVDAVLGDYDGRPWDERAAAWIVLARRPAGRAARGSPPRGARARI